MNQALLQRKLWNEYHNSLNSLSKEFKVVYATYSEGLGECEQIETNPKKVFAEE